MKKVIALAALGLLVGCNTPTKPNPSASASPGVTTPEKTVAEAQAIIAKTKEKGQAFMVESADNGFTMLATSLEKESESLSVFSEAHEAWKTDGLQGLQKFSEAHPGLAENLKPTREQLEAALKKPKFYPILSFDVDAPAPNLVSILSLNRGLIITGLLQMEKEPSAAADSLLLALQSASQLSGKGNLLIQTVCATSLLEALAAIDTFLSSEDLSQDEGQKVLSALTSLPDSSADYSQARDFEFVTQFDLFDDLANGKLEGKDIGEELKNSNFDLQEERKALDMVFTTNRDAISALQDLGDAQAELLKKIESNPKLILAKISAPSTDGMYRRARNANSHLGATTILAAVRLYQLENGTPPETLDALVPKTLESLPNNCMTKDGKYDYSVNDKSFTLGDGAAEEPIQYYPMK